MEGVGERLRKRARDLGMSDAEVARNAELSTQRYGHYVAGRREPDLATLVRICRVLDVTPNDVLLGPMKSAGRSKRDKLKAKLDASVASLSHDDLQTVVMLVDVVVKQRRE